MMLTIGEVAAGAGISVSAVRYYDRFGLVTAAQRVGGKRRFTEDTIGRISFIRRAQDVGFSLDEVKAVLEDNAPDWRSLVASKRSELVAKRERLGIMLAMLDEIAECGCRAVAECPTAVGIP